MEVRRQIAQQRKAEEEKAKLLEEERKMKDEMDRRKREREEMTDKRPIKVAPAKKVACFRAVSVPIDITHSDTGGRGAKTQEG